MLTMKLDADGFQAWLEKEQYSSTTVAGQVRDLKTLFTYSGQLGYPQNLTVGIIPLRIKAYNYTYNLYNTYAATYGKDKLTFDPPPLPEVPRALRRKVKQKVTKHVSIDAQEWKTVSRVIWNDDSPMHRVLKVMISTGLRIGDVLRIEPAQIETAFAREDGLMSILVKGSKPIQTTVRGPAEKPWKELLSGLKRGEYVNVAAYVSPRGGGKWEAPCAAYQSVRRVWIDACDKANVQGERNLHRIRRTVAVFVRKATSRDIAQRVLGHSDGATTERYTDEAQVDQILLGLEAIARFRDGDSDVDLEEQSA